MVRELEYLDQALVEAEARRSGTPSEVQRRQPASATNSTTPRRRSWNGQRLGRLAMRARVVICCGAFHSALSTESRTHEFSLWRLHMGGAALAIGKLGHQGLPNKAINQTPRRAALASLLALVMAGR